MNRRDGYMITVTAIFAAHLLNAFDVIDLNHWVTTMLVFLNGFCLYGLLAPTPRRDHG